MEPLTALVCAVLGAASGFAVPPLVAAIPEPAEPVAGLDEVAGADGLDGLPGSPGSALEADGPADPAGAGEPAVVDVQAPKELYADIARRPGLGWQAAVAGAVSAGLVGLVLGWSWGLLVVLPLVPVSIALAVVDWRTRLLPTWVIKRAYLLCVATVVVTWLIVFGLDDPQPLVRALIGWVAAGGLYFVLWFAYPAGMGYGDVRLSGVLGFVLGYLGWSQLAVGIYGGFLLGGVLGGLLSLLRRVDRKGYPFGPFMLLGALVGVVAGQPVMSALVN